MHSPWRGRPAGKRPPGKKQNPRAHTRRQRRTRGVPHDRSATGGGVKTAAEGDLLDGLEAAFSPESDDRAVPLSAQMIGLRFTAAAAAAAARAE